MESTALAPSSEKRSVGQVKWFNNKAGYGFITMTDESGKEMDIFTHYSTVQVGDAQYKYLVQGEYVEFELSNSTSEKHQYQAANVTGIKGGKLMCETRQNNRSTGNGERTRPIRRGPPRRKVSDRHGSEGGDSQGVVSTQTDKDGFTKVYKKRATKGTSA